MYVTAGGNTTTLTVIRARGRDLIQTSHSSGDAVTVYKATLAANVPFSTAEPAGMIRIETSGNNAHADYGLAIGMDHPGASNMDIANNTILGVSVTNMCGAGVAVGNGTSGNILDQWGYALSISKCGYGVLMDGGALSIDGGDFGYSLVDIKRRQQVSQEVKIDGIRTEELGRFYEYYGSTSGPGVRMSSIEALSIHMEDGVVIEHSSSSTLLMQNVKLHASDVINGSLYVVASSTSPGNPCHVVALNVSSTTGAASVFLETANNRLTVINEQILTPSTDVISPNSNLPNRIEGGLTVDSLYVEADQLITLTSAYTLASQTAAQKLFNASTNGAVTLPVGVFFFECVFDLSSMSATSGSFGWTLAPGSTNPATIAGIKWLAVANKAALATAATPQSTVNTAANTAIATATTNTVGWARITGKVRISAAGTVVPQVSLGVAAAAVVGVDSYFRIWQVASSATATTAGNWS